ncbi:MAG: TetR/AcrR family transcriptional regulator [Thermoleophilaceae bacterium]
MATDLRSDAAANRDRLIEAAREVFAEHGPDVKVEEIARRAGVGVGTLYRRFPGKEQLVSAILEERVAELIRLLAGEPADTDPFTALGNFLEAVVRMQAEDRGVLRLMAQSLGPAAYPDNVEEVYDAVWQLIRRGQRSGLIRPDVKKQDVPTLLRMANAAVSPVDETCTEIAAALRCSALLLDGLRPQ